MKSQMILIMLIISIVGLFVSGCATAIGGVGGMLLDSTRQHATDYSLAALEIEKPGNRLIIYTDDGESYDCKLIDIRFIDSSAYNNNMLSFEKNHPNIIQLPKFGDEVELKVSEDIRTHWKMIAIESNNIRVKSVGDSLYTKIFYKHFESVIYKENEIGKSELISYAGLSGFPDFTILVVKVDSGMVSISANSIVKIEEIKDPFSATKIGLFCGLMIDIFTRVVLGVISDDMHFDL